MAPLPVDLRGEHEHVRTRLALFEDEFRKTSSPDRRRELQQEMLQAARESAELNRRMEAARLLAILAAPAAGALEARYAFEVASPDILRGVVIAAYTDGPRGADGRVLTVAALRGEGDALRACIARLGSQTRELEFTRSERRRTLIDAHGREGAQAIRAEMQEFLRELIAQRDAKKT